MVVWACVPDRNGIIKSEPRPLLITDVHPSNKKGPFVAHCISTRVIDAPNDPVVEMPWDARTGKGTGLYRHCVVVLRWIVIVEQNQVVDVSGKVEPAFLQHVLEQVDLLNGL
ncbi:MAG TPA: hypothetical protein VFW23_16755 [Tepidisphaeraceae bacterium]|nr:hypothetical protein [Tepidisphaeraceae bacterium]